MNWKANHRVPESTEWILGIKESVYPLRCSVCWGFPMILIRVWNDYKRACIFCRAEEYK